MQLQYNYSDHERLKITHFIRYVAFRWVYFWDNCYAYCYAMWQLWKVKQFNFVVQTQTQTITTTMSVTSSMRTVFPMIWVPFGIIFAQFLATNHHCGCYQFKQRAIMHISMQQMRNLNEKEKKQRIHLFYLFLSKTRINMIWYVCECENKYTI